MRNCKTLSKKGGVLTALLLTSMLLLSGCSVTSAGEVEISKGDFELRPEHVSYYSDAGINAIDLHLTTTTGLSLYENMKLLAVGQEYRSKVERYKLVKVTAPTREITQAVLDNTLSDMDAQKVSYLEFSVPVDAALPFLKTDVTKTSAGLDCSPITEFMVDETTTQYEAFIILSELTETSDKVLLERYINDNYMELLETIVDKMYD